MKYILLLIATSIILFAFSDQEKKQVIFSPNVAAPIGPYSQGIKSGGFVFLSGQIALKADGQLDTSSIENETKQVLDNIKLILAADHLQMSDINKVSIYTTNMGYFSRINEVYQSYFNKPYPARETIQVSALPKGAHIEISVIAD